MVQMNSFLILFTIVCCALAKLDLPHPKTIQIESLTGFVGPDGTFDSEDPVPFAGAVVVNGVSQANHLDMDCNNKFCSMMEYAVSCKALGFGVKKICARYLLGYKYGCDIFPAPMEVVNAPSICLPSVFRILPYLKAGPTGLKALIGPYLNASTFAENSCGRTCFQKYQNASHAFYQSCRPQMNATYIPLATAISSFQEYRNQACSESADGKNCYSLIAGLITPAPTEAAEMIDNAIEAARVAAESEAASERELAETAEASAVAAAADHAVVAKTGSNMQTSAIDLLNFQCDYGLGYQTNLFVDSQVCDRMSSFGCCAATGISMATQNPIGGLAAVAAGGAVDPTIFPPCLLKYLKDACPPVDLQLYCTNGSIANTVIITGVLFMPKQPVPPPLKSFPNMYDKTSVLTLQGVMTAGLASVPGFTQWPFLFNAKSPLLIQMMDYTYYGVGFVPLTPDNGQMAQPYASDYTNAIAGNFTFQIVMQDLNATTSAMVYAALKSPYVLGTLNLAYFGDATKRVAKIKSATYPEITPPNPLMTGAGFHGVSAVKGIQWLVTVFVTLGMSALLIGPSSFPALR